MKRKILSIVAFTAITVLAVSCKGEKKNETDAATAKTEKAISSEAVKYKVDTANTTVTWKGSKAIGGSHDGTMNVSSGTFAVKDGKLESGNFIIDINSLKVLDIPAEDEGNAKLKGHLLGEDFFDAKKHGNAVFSVTGIKEENGKTMIEGNLTLKDVKKNISFPAKVTVEGNKAMIVSEVFTIDRTDFGMQYGSSSIADIAKDRIISSDVELSVNLTATKK
jgi:polyisoprenoid-binding protein YceI